MTASYLILTPPGEPAETERAAFVRDGFRWTALFFPVIWLLVHRLWFWAVTAIALQTAAALLSEAPGLQMAGWAVTGAISLLTALEGPHALVRAREARNWTLRSIVSARDLETAEYIYYGEHASPMKPVAAVALPASDTSNQAARPPALGLLGYDGE